MLENRAFREAMDLLESWAHPDLMESPDKMDKLATLVTVVSLVRLACLDPLELLE